MHFLLTFDDYFEKINSWKAYLTNYLKNGAFP